MTGVFAAPLTEREELTLSLNQLIQIEASLQRAQQSAGIGISERYYFDYLRIHGDIATLRSGIEHYLSAEDTTVLYLITRNQRSEQAILPEPAPEKKK